VPTLHPFRFTNVKPWHGIVVAVAIVAIGAFLSMTLGIHNFFRIGAR
jgi:hypothetical protein